MPPFFVLLLDPANTGGLARRCCTSILNLQSISPKFTNWSNPPNKKRSCATFVANIYYFCSLLRYTNIINIENIIIR